jgi:hypothetical protein
MTARLGCQTFKQTNKTFCSVKQGFDRFSATSSFTVGVKVKAALVVVNWAHTSTWQLVFVPEHGLFEVMDRRERQ